MPHESPNIVTMELTIGTGAGKEVDFYGENLTIADATHEMDMVRIDDHTYHLMIDKRSILVTVENLDKESLTAGLRVNGKSVLVSGKDKYAALLESLGMADMASAKADQVKAPMPGMVLEVAVSAGASVTQGQTLLILEAMKMENVIKAPADGIVQAVNATKGVSVEKGDVLIRFE